jgi:hypothetical protein
MGLRWAGRDAEANDGGDRHSRGEARDPSLIDADHHLLLR